VVANLRAHRKAQAERRLLSGSGWHDLDLVVERGDGSPVDLQHFCKRFRRALRAAGLEELTFHQLRHGYASLMLASGVDLKVISGLLGHSSIAITAETYAHVAEKVDRAAITAFDTHLGATDEKGQQSVSNRGD
jgi:integrase